MLVASALAIGTLSGLSTGAVGFGPYFSRYDDTGSCPYFSRYEATGSSGGTAAMGGALASMLLLVVLFGLHDLRRRHGWHDRILRARPQLRRDVGFGHLLRAQRIRRGVPVRALSWIRVRRRGRHPSDHRTGCCASNRSRSA